MIYPTPAILEQTTTTISEGIFPQNKNEIEDWARKYGIINSYTISSSEQIKGRVGKFQKELLKTLIAGDPLSGNQKDFIAKTQQVVKLLSTSTISEGVKKTIIETIATDDNPWMHDGVVSNMVKKINCEEIIPGELVQITHIDYHDSDISIGGVQGYYKPHEPSDVYNHCIQIKQLNELEQKIIALCIDQKPYRKNYTLLTKKADAIKDIIFNREKGVIHFITGNEMHDAFSRYHFLLTIFNDLSRDEFDEQVYDLTIEQKKEKVLNSTWYKSYTPDFSNI